jgi:1-aminocyclopropane-1-carboxylate deaminase/D-cysteine desulfhydrase-like pyridoxal-dependent ACC family enzyme
VNTGKGKAMDPKIVAKERKKNFKMKRFELFCYRTRYFSDAGILGSKEFVQEVFDQVKHLLKFVRAVVCVGRVSLRTGV